MTKLTEAQKHAWASMLVVQSRINQQCEKAMVEAGQVGLDVYDVLVTLEMTDHHRLKMSELADRVLLSRSGITRLVDRLEAKGWIKREACPYDKRCLYAHLTAEGQRVREEAWKIYEPMLAQLWGQHVDETRAMELVDFFRGFGYAACEEPEPVSSPS